MFYTLLYTRRCHSSGLSQYLISGIHPNLWKDTGFCGNGSGRHATNSCSTRHLRGSSTMKPLSPTLCPFVRWRTTSTSSERKCTSLARGCTGGGGGHHASPDQGSEWRATLSSETSSSFCRVVYTIRWSLEPCIRGECRSYTELGIFRFMHLKANSCKAHPRRYWPCL